MSCLTDFSNDIANKFVGFIGVENNNDALLNEHIPKLGKLNNLSEVLEKQKIEEVIIAVETVEHDRLSEILTIVENRQSANLIAAKLPIIH